MTTRLPSLHGQLITFASGPSETGGRDEDIDALAGVVSGHVDGLDVTVRLTRDGVAVLADSDRIRTGLRRKRIDGFDAVDLPPEIPTLANILAQTSDRNPLFVTVGGDSTFEAVLSTARTHGPEVETRLWLVGHDQSELIRWRPRTQALMLLGTARRRVGGGLERLLAEVHGDDLDGVSMPHADWSGGSIALAHRFGLRTHASGGRHNRELASVIDAGIDAITADDPIRLGAVAAEFYPNGG
ncbi:MAG: hypothetical protein OES24_17135 [Acidimicrobiia bacterium]|nr:hypothetical protein [Acidimicrobiia bacterium]